MVATPDSTINVAMAGVVVARLSLLVPVAKNYVAILIDSGPWWIITYFNKRHPIENSGPWRIANGSAGGGIHDIGRWLEKVDVCAR